MLVALNIIPTAEIDLNAVMADVKAQEQREFFPENFQEDNTGTREVHKSRRQPTGQLSMAT